MTRAQLYLLLFVCGAAMVPWFFTEPDPAQVGGWPLWAFYSLAASAGFAVVTAYLLRRFWSVSAGEATDAD